MIRTNWRIASSWAIESVMFRRVSRAWPQARRRLQWLQWLRRSGALVSGCAAALLACTLFADALAAREVPFLSGRVVDQARILKPATRQTLETQLTAFEKETSNQVVVLIIESLRGEPIEDYSLRVVETWKLGQRGRDNGVLFLVVRKDRQMRIEVGYGLEGPLPDALASRILREQVTPQFRSGQFDAGVLAGVGAIQQAIRGEYVAGPEHAEGRSALEIFKQFIFFWTVAFILSLPLRAALRSTSSPAWFAFSFLNPLFSGAVVLPLVLAFTDAWAEIASAAFGVLLAAALFAVKFAWHKRRKFARTSKRDDLAPQSEFENRLADAADWLSSSDSRSSSLASGLSDSSSSSDSGGSYDSSDSFSGGGGDFGGGGASDSW
jgi:uncharacterized protein